MASDGLERITSGDSVGQLPEHQRHPSFTSFKDRLRAFSPGRHDEASSIRRQSMSDDRGRDPTPLISTGRGGAGNLVRSLSRGADEALAGVERGRELRNPSAERATHAGRGGAGNIRSPSRDPNRERLEEAQEDALQEKLISERRGRQADAPFSSGRGGAGNITDSRSRSRSAVRGRSDGSDSPHARESSRTRALNPLGRFNSGRGGYGNITEELGQEDLVKLAAEQRYEAEVKKKYEDGFAGAQHSIGRGGAGSIGQTFQPMDIDAITLEEQEAQKKMHAEHPTVIRGGRGGAGNIKPRGEDEGHERGRSSGGVFGSVFRSLSRATRGEA